MVGIFFLSEGIQKFLFADKLGSGRFENIGLPAPDFLRPFVGSFEIHMKAIWNGKIIAESDDTVVIEGNHYFLDYAV